MMGNRERWGVWPGVASLALVAVLAGAAGSPAAPSPGAAGLVAVLVVGTERFRNVGGLVGSIATGALGLGGVAWLAATQTTALPLSDTLATGLGLAVGGGLGSVVWLLGPGGTEESDSTETVTVDMEGEDGDAPAPEPVDLFEASPDPICFYAEADGRPVVRAVNPAFRRRFGVSSDALDGVPLGDGSLVAERADDLVTAAREGQAFDETLDCETDTGQRPMRIRIAATGRGRTDGYVIYTPVEV